jgi:hypothetical protein
MNKELRSDSTDLVMDPSALVNDNAMRKQGVGIVILFILLSVTNTLKKSLFSHNKASRTNPRQNKNLV